ncbi:hypothetical protein [Immundisolibacter sp.]
MDIQVLGSSGFKINPLHNSEQEKKRLEYKPKKVRFLFVGESMPAGGTFFYFENSNLYNYTKEAFLQNFDWAPKEFLKYFMSNGFYLDDLCQEPINHLSESEKRQARKAYEQSLAIRIKECHPLIIVSTPKSIEKNVNSAINIASLNIENYSLPFPAMGNQYKYVDALDKLLKDIIKP